jgi:hypothetical protein
VTPGRKDRRPVKDFPKTIDDAVDRLLLVYGEEEKAEIRATSKVDLIRFHHTFGQGIRNSFGLWGENTELLATLAPADRCGDNASMIIIEALWSRLRDEEAGLDGSSP